jgi:hypothetical protein
MANREDIDDDIDTILRYCGFAEANDRIAASLKMDSNRLKTSCLYQRRT